MALLFRPEAIFNSSGLNNAASFVVLLNDPTYNPQTGNYGAV